MLNSRIVYFSPTGTTKAVLKGIARGIGSEVTEFIDITTPEARNSTLSMDNNEILLIGVPVYMGRVPDILSDWFKKLKIQNTPTVCVVVYGNRAYENALLELSDIIRNGGGFPVAAGAYIGEHSFSDSSTPVALGRPDQNDLKHAEEFGKKVRKKLEAALVLSDSLMPEIPGSHPYGGITDLWNIDFIAVDKELCSECGICADVCPAGAVSAADSAMIDEEKCITCCACIKSCPQNARSIKESPLREAQKRLVKLYSVPKSNEVFI